MKACVICGNDRDNRLLRIKEMNFGSGVEYTYLECSKCGCLQIQDPPPDDVAYPNQYFSFQKPHEGEIDALSNLRLCLRKLNARWCLDSGNVIGRLLRIIRGEHYLFKWFRMANVTLHSDILDVGCGTGTLLLYLRSIGFTSLVGVDPLIMGDIYYPNGVKIYKRSIYDLSDTFDFIMLNHSLEHMADHISGLIHLEKLLKPGGYILIRTPIASSYAYRKYSTRWAQLDAPRHRVIHTLYSMHILAKRARLKVAWIEYDSTAFQFIASEQFCLDIATMDANSYYVCPERSVISERQAKKYTKLARFLNEVNDGDSACFLLHTDH